MTFNRLNTNNFSLQTSFNKNIYHNYYSIIFVLFILILHINYSDEMRFKIKRATNKQDFNDKLRILKIEPNEVLLN
jgi:hypothetical protein